MPIIKLQSSDDKIFTVELDIIRRSVLINTMLNVTDDANDDEGESTPVPIPNVDGATLGKVIEWLTHHKDDPPAAEEDPKNKDRLMQELVISPWDQEFLKVDNHELFQIILAANFLDIKALLDISCKTVSNMMRGKTAEQIRAIFNIENDFAPGEEEKIREHNKWCEGS